MRRLIIGLLTHGTVAAAAFALGIYMLPILTAPEGPDAATLSEAAKSAGFTATLSPELRGNDFLHWGEGVISVTPDRIIHEGRLAPGPDYKLYLTEEFVEHEDEFLPTKSDAVEIGDVKTFDGFLIDVPEGVNVAQFSTVVIWCETFGEFVTAGKYQ